MWQEHPNAILVRRMYKAIAEGDMATLDEIIDENLVMHVPGRFRMAGDYHGRHHLAALAAESNRIAGGTLRIEPHDVLASEEHAIGLHYHRAERDGLKLNMKNCVVMHIRDNKITEIWEHPFELHEDEEFYG